VESDLNILSGVESLVILSGSTGYYDLSIRPLRRGLYSGVIAFVAEQPEGYVMSFVIGQCELQGVNQI